MDNLNIRKIGSYEIVITDINKKRLFEVVTNESAFLTNQEAIRLVEVTPEAYSYWVSKIIYNPTFDVWSPKHG